MFSSPCVSDIVVLEHSTPPEALINSDYSCKQKHGDQGVVSDSSLSHGVGLDSSLSQGVGSDSSLSQGVGPDSSLSQSVGPDSSLLPSTFVSKKIEDNPNDSQQFVQDDRFENNPWKKMSQKVVTIGSHDCKVYCLCAKNGHLLWSRALDSAVFSTPFSFCLQQSSVTLPISNHSKFTDFSSEVTNSVAVCGSKGTLYILDLASGIVRGKFQFPGELFSSPCVLGDRLIVGCRDNFVYCVKLSAFPKLVIE